MTNSSVTVTGSNNLWKVGGNWSDANGHFAVSTSTIEFTASVTVTTLNSSGDIQFYNVTVDAGKTATVASSVGIQNVITVNGTWTQNTAGQTLFIRDDAGTGTPMVIGSSGQINGTTNTVTIYFFIQSGTITHIPGKTYSNVRLRFYPQPTVSGLGFEFRLDGSVTAASLQFYGHSTSPYFVNSQTYDVTLNGDSGGDCINDANVAATSYGIAATSGTWTLTCSGGLNMTAASSSTFYIQFGASVWNLDGAVSLNVVTSTTNWQVGTGTFRFFISSASTNPVFPNFTANFANNLTFQCNFAASCVYTLTTNPVKISGAFTVSGPSFNSIFTTSTLTVTAGSVTIGASGTINQGSATFTVSGWDSNAGTYNYQTGTIAFAGNGTLRTFGSTGNATLYALSVANGATATVHSSGIGVAQTMVVNGTLTLAGAVYLRNEGASNDPLTMGASGAMSTSGGEQALVFLDQGGTLVHIPGRTYASVLIEFSPRVTVSGDGFEYRLTGNVVAGEFLFAQASGSPLFLNTSTYNVTLNATTCLGDSPVGAASIGIKATSGAWSLTCPSGGVHFASVSSTLYIQFGSSAWTLDGPWIITSGVSNAKWNAGTSIVTLDSSSSTVTVNPGSLTVSQFNDFTVTSTYASHNIDVLGGNLLMSGLFRIYGISGDRTATLDTVLNSNFSMTMGKIQIDAFGHIQPRMSNVTITGPTWTTTNGAADHSPYGGAAFEFGGLSTVIFSATAGTTITINDPNSYSETYWNVSVADGKSITLATDYLVLNRVTIGIATGATVHFATHVIAMKGDVPDVLTIRGTSTFDNSSSLGGFAFNSVNGPELVPGYDYGAITLFFYTSSNVFLPAESNYQRLMGNVTTTGTCAVYSFFVGPKTIHFLDLNGQTLTCGTLTLGGPGFGSASATPYILGGTGHVIINGDVTIGTVASSAYIIYGSSTWTIYGNWTSASTSSLWSASSASVVEFAGIGAQTIAGGAFPLIRFATAAQKNFTQSFSSAGLKALVAVIMVLTAGITWTDSDSLSGLDATHLLTLRSSSPGTPWHINVIADRIATFVNVQDSAANLTIIVCDNVSVDAGDNMNWAFQPACPAITLSGAEMIGMLQLITFFFVLGAILTAALWVKRKRSEG